MNDEQPQQTPRTDDGWRQIRDGMTLERRAQLYAGELFVSGTDPETGEVCRQRLEPPAWLALEDELDR